MKAIIPQYMHKPNKIKFLDTDEFMFILNAIFLGIFLRSVIMFFAGLGIFWFYRKGKSKYPRGFFKHLPHIMGIRNFQYFSDIFVKHFKE